MQEREPVPESPGTPGRTAHPNHRAAHSDAGPGPRIAEDGTGGGRRARRRRPARADVLWSLLLAVLAIAFSTVGVVNGPDLSAFDEHTHLDYALQLRHGQIPHEGSELLDETLQEWSCRGQDNINDHLPTCEQITQDRVDAGDYPARGENYNSWHPPLYYLITAAVAGAGEALLGISFTVAARLTGGLWLAAALVAMYAVLRMSRLPRWLAGTASATLLAVPTILHASSTVTNDAPAALLGVAGLWLLTRVVVQGRLGWAVPTVVAVLAASTKLMNTVGILTAVGVVALSAIPALRERRFADAAQRVGVAVGPIVGIAAVAVGWSMFQAGRTSPGWTSPIAGISTQEIKGSPLDEWAMTLMSTFGLVDNYYLQPSLGGIAVQWYVSVLQVLLIAAPFVGLAVFERGRPERMVAWAALAGAIAVPLLVQVQELVRDGGYFVLVSNRYAVTLIPLTIAVLAFVAHERRWRAAPVGVTVLGVGIMALAFVGIL